MVAKPAGADGGDMTNTTIAPPDSHPSPSRPGRRTGATWVAATGAFLLLAGAAVFVAVQWDRMAENAKLAVVLGLTAAVLVGGRRLRRTLPATGDVLFHLGAFLMPIDLAGIGISSGVAWRPLLVAEGVLGVVALGGLGLLTRSTVLMWAGILSMGVLAAGIAAVSPVPAAAVLAAAALAVELTRRAGNHDRGLDALGAGGERDPRPAAGALRAGRRSEMAAAIWAGVAGLAPVLAAAVTLLVPVGRGTLAELGFTTPGAAAVAGVLAAAVLARQAHLRHDLTRAFLAVASVAVGATSSLVTAHLPSSATAVALAAAFVVIEVAALVLRRDPFWHRPLGVVAELAEIGAGVAAVATGLFLLTVPAIDVDPSATTATALALAAIGWLTADIRRYRGTPRPLGLTLLRGGCWPPATIPLAVSVAGAVALATGSALATAIALVATAAALLAARRPESTLVAATFVPWAVVTGMAHPTGGTAVGLAGAVVLALAAVDRARVDNLEPTAGVLALLATGTALAAVGIAVPDVGLPAGIAAAVAACWLLSLLLDLGHRRLGDIARLALLLPVAASFAVAPGEALPATIAAVLLYAVDAVRLDRPEIGMGGALAVQAVVAHLARANGLDLGETGLALCVGAVVWSGLAAVVDGRWRLPFLVAAGAGLGLGLATTVIADDIAAMSTALLVTGGLGIGAGLATGRSALAHAGAAACTGGIFGHLGLAGVEASEPYVVPVAAQILAWGWQARRSNPKLSSWLAYAPPVFLLGGTALAERMIGGPGWHALVAGAVGMAAVAAGGWSRTAGPLVTGTAILVTLTVHESLGTLAGVPTWAWLATGGTILLGTGIALERSDTSPIEATHRLVDVLTENFT